MADVGADRNISVVAAENVGQTQLAPHLAKAGVDVQKYSTACGGQDLFIAQRAHDIDQTFRTSDTVQNFFPRKPN